MGGIVSLVAIFIVFGLVLGALAFVAYRRVLRRAKGVERGLKMVPLLIHLPPPSDDTQNSGVRDVRDVMREKINQAQTLYDLIAGTAQGGFKSSFYGQRHIAFEIIANNGLVHYFAAVPIALVSVVEQAIVTAYPGARLEEVEDHNIFNPQGRLTGTVGGELVLQHEASYPIALVDQMERDPMAGLINALYKLQVGDGAAVQIMLRPAADSWRQRAIKLVAKKRHTRQGGLGFGLMDVAKGAVKTSEEWRERAKTFEISKLEETTLQAIEEKTKHPGFEVLIRVLASSPQYDRSQMILRSLTTSFALFEAPGSNGFQFVEARDIQGLVTAFIFRFFPPELVSNVLNSVELATLFHLPDAQFTPTTQVDRQQSKQVDGPAHMPQTGLLLGYNFYRGIKKEIRLGPEDRRRHLYIVGQTGTGKSTMLENLAVQDMLSGGGFAFIDPHGDTAEKLLAMVPKERAEDVVYFNPSDMQQPLGLNLFEFDRPEQKDFLIQESINMLYKLYDPGKTGIIGPRFEHWYRNAALTLMADPHGASFIEIPKVFTDTAYLKNKFKYLNDPTVIDFWTKEMGQTSDYHKSEMLGWFVSKFGAFQSNEMMRNIIGQTRSSFNLREIMDNKKILIVNLSKGQVGELNSQLLGMIFVIKVQAAAMSRAAVSEDQRPDFCLYVDEFQNFSTDSFASILSEARKYHLNLIVANQFIGQLTDEIRDAVFGNIGTMMSYRCGPEDAEFLIKQFEPIFEERDLVNLPNHNAVMKLLIGGLPSQPFSITALPPLGVAHPELGLAIKQLSAAKYGISRAVVEADVFARLQGQPQSVTPPSAPEPEKPPVAEPVLAAASPSPSVAPAADVTPVAPAVTPVAPPSPVAASPAPAAAPSVASPPSEADAHAAMLPPSMVAPPVAPTPTGSVTGVPAVPAPKPVPPKPAAPPAPDELSLSQLRVAAPVVSPEPALTPPTSLAPSVEQSKIPDHPEPVFEAPKPAEPHPVPVKPAPSQPTKLIEAHETDGRPASPPSIPPKPPSQPLHSPKPSEQLAPSKPKLIEAHETDGEPAKPSAVEHSAKLPHPAPAPKPAPTPTASQPKPSLEPKHPEPQRDTVQKAAAPKTMIATQRTRPVAPPPEPKLPPVQPKPPTSPVLRPKPEPVFEAPKPAEPQPTPPKPAPPLAAPVAPTYAAAAAPKAPAVSKSKPKQPVVTEVMPSITDLPAGGDAPGKTLPSEPPKPPATAGDQPPKAGTLIEPSPEITPVKPIIAPSAVAHPGVAADTDKADGSQDNKAGDKSADVPAAVGGGAALPKPPAPDLKPGEIFVDDNGNVIQG